jgi:hypothetical protein
MTSLVLGDLIDSLTPSVNIPLRHNISCIMEHAGWYRNLGELQFSKWAAKWAQ